MTVQARDRASHHGVLHEDSPGLHNIFRKLFGKEELLLLENAYALTSAHGGLHEGSVPREEGVSYNPRPARIAQILHRETACVEADLYVVAMLSCCAPDAACFLEAEFPKQTAMCRPVWQQLALPAADVPQTVAEITLCHVVDQARHLHMSTLSDDDRRNFVHYVTDEVLVCAPQPADSNLSRKLHHWASTFASMSVKR